MAGICSGDRKKAKAAGKNTPHYPQGMAKDIDELTDWWSSGEFIDNNAKRLLLFATNEPDWNIISQNWDNVLHFPLESVDDLEYEGIIETISNSI